MNQAIWHACRSLQNRYSTVLFAQFWGLSYHLLLGLPIVLAEPPTTGPNTKTASVSREPSTTSSTGNQETVGTAISIGERRTIQSKILNEDRDYLVYLPSSYDSESYLPQSYPVLFLFDGDVQFHLVTGMVSFMSEAGWQIPEMIVIGIPHRNRTRELTPTRTLDDFRPGQTSEQQRESGGGDDFFKFVTTELIPKVDSEYRTRPYRVLFGHSYGGLLAAHAFTKADESFQAYLLADPSLWWDDRLPFKQLNRAVASGKLNGANRAIFISHVPTYRAPGNESLQSGFENIKESIVEFASKLDSLENVRVRNQTFESETHHSVPIKTLQAGLRFVFEGYEMPQEYFLGQPQKIRKHFEAASRLVGLELLPSEPVIDMWANAFMSYDDDLNRYALPLFKLNAENYPRSPHAFSRLGNAYLERGMKPEAREAFEKTLKLDPKNEAAVTGIERLSNAP